MFLFPVTLIVVLSVLFQSTNGFLAQAHKSFATRKALKSTTHAEGYEILSNPLTNKGTSFTTAEKDKYGLHGLVPAGDRLSLDVKVGIAINQLRKKSSPMEKYIFLHTIQDSEETLFYAILMQHLTETMPLVYTPTVGQACTEWSHIYRHVPRGLYLSTKDKGKIADILRRNRNPNIKVIVVTDGERILGLGDLGANGMGIPIGKLALYTACAGIHPEQCLPVVLDVGTNTDSIREDIAYLGLRQRRDRSQAYDDLVEEFFTASQEVYGRDVLIQFEDFGNANAFRLLERYRHRATCFNDDIQGTASVTLGGLFASLPISGKQKLSEHRFLFYGAGEAGVGIADLISTAIAEETGHPLEIARQQAWFVDSKGLITSHRMQHGNHLEHHKQAYAHDVEKVLGKKAAESLEGTSAQQLDVSKLLDAVKLVKPTAIIGVSAQGQAFSKEVIEELMKYNEKPVIFALSNPTTKAECTAEQAYTWTNGKAIFASGSPFDPVSLPDGRRFTPGQGNNAYIFPGVGLGALIAKARTITDDDFLVAAKALATKVSKDRLAQGAIYPLIEDIREVSKEIAAAVAANIQFSGRSDAKSVEEKVDWRETAEKFMYTPSY